MKDKGQIANTLFENKSQSQKEAKQGVLKYLKHVKQ